MTSRPLMVIRGAWIPATTCALVTSVWSATTNAVPNCALVHPNPVTWNVASRAVASTSVGTPWSCGTWLSESALVKSTWANDEDPPETDQ